jgi:hypothetical protein
MSSLYEVLRIFLKNKKLEIRNYHYHRVERDLVVLESTFHDAF